MDDPVWQMVVPSSEGLRAALKSGHLGVGKTYDSILLYFFWPQSNKDVSRYIKISVDREAGNKY